MFKLQVVLVKPAKNNTGNGPNTRKRSPLGETLVQEAQPNTTTVADIDPEAQSQVPRQHQPALSANASILPGQGSFFGSNSTMVTPSMRFDPYQYPGYASQRYPLPSYALSTPVPSYGPLGGISFIGDAEEDSEPQVKKFLLLTKSTNSLLQVAQEIVQKYQKLYPETTMPIEIAKLQDSNQCDLDPDYVVSDVFDHSSVLFAILSPDNNMYNNKTTTNTKKTPIDSRVSSLSLTSQDTPNLKAPKRKATAEYFESAKPIPTKRIRDSKNSSIWKVPDSDSSPVYDVTTVIHKHPLQEAINAQSTDNENAEEDDSYHDELEDAEVVDGEENQSKISLPPPEAAQEAESSQANISIGDKLIVPKKLRKKNKPITSSPLPNGRRITSGMLQQEELPDLSKMSDDSESEVEKHPASPVKKSPAPSDNKVSYTKEQIMNIFKAQSKAPKKQAALKKKPSGDIESSPDFLRTRPSITKETTEADADVSMADAAPQSSQGSANKDLSLWDDSIQQLSQALNAKLDALQKLREDLKKAQDLSPYSKKATSLGSAIVHLQSQIKATESNLSKAKLLEEDLHREAQLTMNLARLNEIPKAERSEEVVTELEGARHEMKVLKRRYKRRVDTLVVEPSKSADDVLKEIEDKFPDINFDEETAQLDDEMDIDTSAHDPLEIAAQTLVSIKGTSPTNVEDDVQMNLDNKTDEASAVAAHTVKKTPLKKAAAAKNATPAKTNTPAKKTTPLKTNTAAKKATPLKKTPAKEVATAEMAAFETKVNAPEKVTPAKISNGSPNEIEVAKSAETEPLKTAPFSAPAPASDASEDIKQAAPAESTAAKVESDGSSSDYVSASESEISSSDSEADSDADNEGNVSSSKKKPRVVNAPKGVKVSTEQALKNGEETKTQIKTDAAPKKAAVAQFSKAATATSKPFSLISSKVSSLPSLSQLANRDLPDVKEASMKSAPVPKKIIVEAESDDSDSDSNSDSDSDSDISSSSDSDDAETDKSKKSIANNMLDAKTAKNLVSSISAKEKKKKKSGFADLLKDIRKK